MPYRRYIATLLVVSLAALSSHTLSAQLTTAAASAPSPISRQEVEGLIRQLGDKDFPSRDAADKKLRALGWRAMSYMIVGEPLASDEESKTRLANIMEGLCWSTDGFSPESAKIINDYRDPNSPNHKMAESKIRDGPTAAVAYRSDAILEHDWPTTTRSLMFTQGYFTLERINALRPKGAWEQLEWELLAASDIPNLRFILKLRPDDAAPLLVALESLSANRAQSGAALATLNELRMAVIFAAGDADRSLVAAKGFGDTPYQHLILAQRQDWGALSKFSDAAGAGAKLILGDTIGADEQLSELIDEAFKHSERDICDLPTPVVLLGRVALLNEGGRLYPSNDRAVEALLLQRRYKDALALHSDPSAPKKHENIGGGTDGRLWSWGPSDVMNAQADARLAWALARLNERDRAVAEISRLDDFGKVPYFLDLADKELNRPEKIKARQEIAKDTASRTQSYYFAEADPANRYLEALKQMRQGNPADGEALRREADESLAGSINSRFTLAKVLLKQGETEFAIEQLKSAVEFDAPESIEGNGTRPQAHRLLAQLDQKAGRFKDALQHYRLSYFAGLGFGHLVGEGFDENYQFAKDMTYCESRAALEAGDRVAGLRAAINLITLDPEDLDLILPLISAFKAANFAPQAASIANLDRQLLQNTLKDFPDSHLHHFLIARLDIQSGFTNEQTETHLQKAKSLAPDNPEYQKLK